MILKSFSEEDGNDLAQLSSPHRVLVDAAGNIYAADVKNVRVMLCYPAATQGTAAVSGNDDGKGVHKFKRPNGLSFDRHGHLYVANHCNRRL
jgi:DNA-binding beta-propeller fold protein YncE